MKKRRIIIAVIAMLSVWAVIVTITAVDNENRRSRLYDECVSLKEEVEAYEKLKTEYAELETEYAELEDKYIRGLAFEVLWDMGARSNSAVDSLDCISEREGLTFSERTKVSSAIWEIIDEYNLEKD